jgi:hypothetical protein
MIRITCDVFCFFFVFSYLQAELGYVLVDVIRCFLVTYNTAMTEL